MRVSKICEIYSRKMLFIQMCFFLRFFPFILFVRTELFDTYRFVSPQSFSFLGETFFRYLTSFTLVHCRQSFSSTSKSSLSSQFLVGILNGVSMTINHSK